MIFASPLDETFRAYIVLAAGTAKTKVNRSYYANSMSALDRENTQTFPDYRKESNFRIVVW
jgi:hypothetical protein